MSSDEVSAYNCEQLIWGKIIQDGWDVEGYKIVAKTENLTDQDLKEILSLTGSGEPHADVQGNRAYAFSHISQDRVVFSCTQKSPKPEHHARHYLQTHFLVIDWTIFEAIQADLVYLAGQIGEIRVFGAEETLEIIDLSNHPAVTNSHSSLQNEIVDEYKDKFLEDAYQVLKGNNPVAVFDSSENQHKVLRFFQLLILLTPKTERKQLAFTSNTSNFQSTQFKFIVNPHGILKHPHIVIRLDENKIVPENLIRKLPTYEIFNYRINLREMRGDGAPKMH